MRKTGFIVREETKMHCSEGFLPLHTRACGKDGMEANLGIR